jgi:DNA mismatch repair protein MutL
LPQKIKILERSVSEKIAAGEVVENPSSVVKELIENSIDAGSDRIEVYIERGGKELIRVVDNGEGIEREDVGRAFLRHATSKLSGEEDLSRIKSLGFRGEALAAIAAVSMVNLTTRTKDSIEGTLYSIDRNRDIKCIETGCAQGTCIEVRELFYNTPARLEYLKNDSHEASMVADTVSRLALARPDISIMLSGSGRKLLDTPGNGVLEDTIAAVYGRAVLENLFVVKYKDEGLEIEGYVSKPHGTKSSRSFQSFFINGRFIKSRIITKALEEAYRTLIMVNRYPMAILHFTLRADSIDVNVHPAKLEAKFKEEDRIRRAVFNSVRTALEKGRWIAPASGKSTAYTAPAATRQEPVSPQSSKNSQGYGFSEESVEYNRIELDNNIEGGSFKIPPMRVIGQFLSTFIIAEGEDCVYLIDQHAAHERIVYEKLSKDMQRGGMASQALLEPIVVDLSPIEKATARENETLLSTIGYRFDEFGVNSIVVRAVPVFLGIPQSREFLTELINRLARQSDKEKEEFKQEDIIRMACKKAVKANQRLTQAEMENLLKQLRNAEMPFTCPHGRPVFISLTRYELEKMFKRIV